MTTTTRYFRGARAGTYFAACGEAVTYYSPEHPEGFPSQWTLADMERCAAKRPDTDGEIGEEAVAAIRVVMAEAIEVHQRRLAESQALAASMFREPVCVRAVA